MSGTLPGVTLTQLAAGTHHSLAVGSDGHAYAWGASLWGQLGDGTTTARNAPVRVDRPAGVSFVSVAASPYSSFAIDANGNAYAWGYNAVGNIGDGSNIPRHSPVRVAAPAGLTFSAIAGGMWHTVALGPDGRAYAWGQNWIGQLGTDAGFGSLDHVRVPQPVTMPQGIGFTSISAGQYFTVALGSDGNAYTWGYNARGQLGDGSVTNRPTPTPVRAPSGANFTSVAAGDDFVVATASDGNAYAWGNNSNGQLGDDTIDSRSSPVQVHLPTGVSLTQVAAGGQTVVAQGSDGAVYAWGSNNEGQVGDGSLVDRGTPVPMRSQPGVGLSDVAVGGAHALALGPEGKAYAWGTNRWEVLGAATSEPWSSIPLEVVTDSPVLIAVRFGDVVAPESTQHEQRWTAKTPPGCGSADVIVDFHLYGEAHTEVTARGFTWGAPVTVIASPQDSVAPPGAGVALVARAAGDPVPEVQWQRFDAASNGWRDVDGATSPTYTPMTSAKESARYRAVFTNCFEAVATEEARVRAFPDPGPEQPPVVFAPSASDSHLASSLADSGGRAPWALAAGGAALAAAGGAVLVAAGVFRMLGSLRARAAQR